MRALVFLVSRSLLNGFRRMFSSVRRLISAALIIGYWSYYLLRPWGGSSSNFANPIGHPRFAFPQVEILDAGLFAVFMVVSIPLLLSITSYNKTMRPADVDVLFPTPVDPKLVMGMRLIRDYLATLLIPLILGLFAWRQARLESIFSGLPHPETAGYVIKTAAVSWFLMAMVWTCFGYAATLFINRSDLASERNKRILHWSAAIVIGGTIAYVYVAIKADISWARAISLAHSPALRIPYFIPALGTELALGPITGIGASFVAGLCLLGLLGVGYAIALTQVGWMYDQAAVRGFESIESMKMRRSGDIFAIAAESARKGKVRAGRQTSLHRLRVRPAGTMAWREAILQLRAMKTSMILFFIIAAAYSLAPILLSTLGHSIRSEVQGFVFLGALCLALFMMVNANATTGFIEFLRRVDLLKPLPFTPARLIVMEILAKSIMPIAFVTLCSLIDLVAIPGIWPFFAASLISFTPLALTMTAVILTITLLFPEIEDPTQRGFRGIMQLLGMAIVLLPGVVAFALLYLWTKTPIWGALLASGLNISFVFGLSVLAGNLYVDYNPSD